jgi:acyl carrier protein
LLQQGLAMDIESRVRAVLKKTLLLEQDQIVPGALLVEDLGVSSLDRFELLMGLEEEFGIDVPEQDQDKMKSVGDIVQYIESHLKTA